MEQRKQSRPSHLSFMLEWNGWVMLLLGISILLQWLSDIVRWNF